MSEQDEWSENPEEMPEMEDSASIQEAEPQAVEQDKEPDSEPEALAEPDEIPVAPETGLQETGAVFVVDLNTATDEELQKLPGIGPALAESIIDYRSTVHPFREPAEITFVPGISQSTYDRIAAQVIASPIKTQPSAVKAPPSPPLDAEPPLVQVIPAKGPGWARFLFVGLVSALLGAVLALAVLWGINGTLDFLNEETLRPVWTQTGELEDQIKALNTGLTSVEGRLEVVHDLGLRLDQVQSDLQGVNDDLGAMREQMAAFQEELKGVQTAIVDNVVELSERTTGIEGQTMQQGERITQLEEGQFELQARVGFVEEQMATAIEQVERMRGVVSRFGAFLVGLQELLDQSAESWPSPTRAPPSTPITSEPSTPQPVVTVIPLATPTPIPTSNP
jgi:competence ComEA-like helix-hairpin-helix protein